MAGLDVVLSFGTEETDLAGPNGSLGTVGYLELRKDVFYVNLDRGRANDQPVRNLPVGLPLSHESQYLELSRRQRFWQRPLLEFGR